MKLSAILLVLIFAGVAFAGQATPVDDKKAGDAEEARWQGHIVRMNKDQSSLSIRGGQGNMAPYCLARRECSGWTDLYSSGQCGPAIEPLWHHQPSCRRPASPDRRRPLLEIQNQQNR